MDKKSSELVVAVYPINLLGYPIRGAIILGSVGGILILTGALARLLANHVHWLFHPAAVFIQVSLAAFMATQIIRRQLAKFAILRELGHRAIVINEEGIKIASCLAKRNISRLKAIVSRGSDTFLGVAPVQEYILIAWDEIVLATSRGHYLSVPDRIEIETGSEHLSIDMPTLESYAWYRDLRGRFVEKGKWIDEP